MTDEQYILHKIAHFSEKYEADCLNSEKHSLLSNWEALRTDWWLGFRFFLNRAFMQGRRDSVSVQFLKATNKALATLLPLDINMIERSALIFQWYTKGWLCLCNKDNNPIKKALHEEYPIDMNGKSKDSITGKARDCEMVLDIFRFICEKKSAEGQILNIAAYAAECIEAGNTEKAHKELDEIWQIGPKIAAFFLRDLATVLQLKPVPRDYRFLQPVDTWVGQIADKLNIHADKLVDACQSAGVDPIRFNQGAWYLGKHSLDLLLENLDGKNH